MLTFNKIIENLENGTHFSMQRWGDGELKCYFGYQGSNCDGVEYTPELQAELKQSVNPKIYTGIQPLARRIMSENVTEFEKLVPEEMLFNADILHKESMNNGLGRFFKALEGKDVVLVGPERLSILKHKLSFYHIVVSDKINHDNIFCVGNVLSKSIISGDIILYCASMYSNVLIQDFYCKNITQIDCGSVFEPYVGHANRTYHHDVLKKLNTL